MDIVDKTILTYSEQHTSPSSTLLAKIDRDTQAEVMYPRMLSGHLQGRILSMLSKMLQPKRILELGTFTGYSALCLAEGLIDGGKIITIENNSELESRICSYVNQSPYSEVIELKIGTAVDVIPTLDEMFDLVFIDADKVNYSLYYNLVFDKVCPGGYIIADNVLWSGKVLGSDDYKDEDTRSLVDFNSMIREDSRVENVLLPVRDGLMIIRKLNP